MFRRKALEESTRNLIYLFYLYFLPDIRHMNELNEFYNLYPAGETRGSSPGMYSPAVDGVYSVRRWQSGKDVGNYSTSRGVRTWRILAQVIICDFCYYSQHAIHGVHSHVVTGVWCGEVGICDKPCVYCLCLAGRVLFSTRAPVQLLTTANQRRT